jgi:putative phage-type endonuclease
MRTHYGLKQGTEAWLNYRREHFNASDAPAMLGESPYKTREQLLHEYFTGISPEVDEATQRRFDDGHRFEELARKHAEKAIGEDLYPVVGSEGKFSASFDGIDAYETLIWEHKTLNDSIRDALAIKSDDVGRGLPLVYRIQMEQQLMVSGAERCLFMASKWGPNDELIEMLHCFYHPDAGLRERIVRGWAQFEIDLREYQPQAVEVKPIGRTPESLPALHITVTGTVTASNLFEFKQHALAAFDDINTDLVTDEDFANAEKAVKWLGEVEDRLAAAKQHALSQTRDIDELFRTIDDIMAESKRKRLDMDKNVKTRKETMKTEIVTGARMALGQHIAALNDRLGRPLMPAISADFAGAIKGKKNFDSMRDAVNTMLAAAKVDANMVADRIQANLTILKEHEPFGFLFSDVQVIALKQPDDLKLLVESRISNYRAAEAAKTEAAEEAREAKRKQEEEAARIAAEAALKAASAVQPITPPPAAPAAANHGPILAELNSLLVRLSDSQIERVLHFVQSRFAVELGLELDHSNVPSAAKKPGYRTSGPRKLAA